MNILLALVPISLVLLGIAIWAFVWAVKRGQFDDLETPALDILADDAIPAEPGVHGAPAPEKSNVEPSLLGAPAPGKSNVEPSLPGSDPPQTTPDVGPGPTPRTAIEENTSGASSALRDGRHAD